MKRRRGEDRLAAHAHPARLAVAAHAGVLEIVERQVRLEHRAVRRPLLLGEARSLELPARLADEPLRALLEPAAEFARVDEAVVLVQLPVPVRADLGQPAIALLAVAQRLLDAVAVRDVAGDAAIAAKRSVVIEDRLAAHARDALDVSLGVAAEHDEIAENLAALERADVVAPFAGRRLETQLPAALADDLASRERRLVRGTIRKLVKRSSSSCSQYQSADNSITLRKRSSLSRSALRSASVSTPLAPSDPLTQATASSRVAAWRNDLLGDTFQV
jgi:hypothetical protein